MVSRGTIHFVIGLSASPKVSTADNNANVNAQRLYVCDFLANVSELFGVDTRSVFARKCFAGKFDNDAFILQIFLCHSLIIPCFLNI